MVIIVVVVVVITIYKNELVNLYIKKQKKKNPAFEAGYMASVGCVLECVGIIYNIWKGVSHENDQGTY